jgi:hypothetical protein
MHIPKAKNDTDSLTVFFAVWDLCALRIEASSKHIGEIDPRSWLINAIHALYATSALVVRTPKTESILNGIFNDGTERSSDHRMTEPNWTVESDVDLMQWATEIPSDWQLSGKCSAYLFGCSGHGELADAGKT